MRFDKEEFKYGVKFLFSFGTFHTVNEDNDNLCELLGNGLLGGFFQLLFWCFFPISLLITFLLSVKLN